MLTGVERIKRALDQLSQSKQSAFFGALAAQLKMETTTRFPTAATNGKQILFNLDFVAEQPDAELLGLWIHEVLHPASGHLSRMGDREPELFNEACDYEINPQIIAAGFKLPKGALIDSRFAGMRAEMIYSILFREREAKRQEEQESSKSGKPQSGGSGGQQSQGGQQSGQTQQSATGTPGAPQMADKGQCGVFIPSDSESENQTLTDEWDARVIQAAAVAARHAGFVPESLRQTLAAIHKPSIDWRSELARYVTRYSESKQSSWKRVNRRFVSSGLYLPSRVSDGRNHLIVFNDNSGSIFHDKLAVAAFTAEIQAMLDDGLADQITVVSCDTKINSIAEFRSGDRLTLETSGGGGGTDFSDVMSWAADNSGDAACIVFFTDMECDQWGNDPGVPVLWANWSRPPRNPPAFGDIIQIDGHS